MENTLLSALLYFIEALGVTVALLLVTAYVLLADRKIWAAVQMRRGPNVVGPFGLLQSFADLLKFVFKEPIIPSSSNRVLFLLAPFLMVILSLSAWAVIPFSSSLVVSNLNVGLLYIMAISSMGVYAIIIGGWASNSRYPFLSALRAAAQMISYEVSIGFIFLAVILLSGSLNLSDIVLAQRHIWFFIPLFPLFVVFFISALAETNRPPFDLAEAESELVAGFMVEYSSTPYLMFMLGEYVNILLMCSMTTILFLGGWLPPFHVIPFTWVPGILWFLIKSLLVFFLFALVKAIVPRYRYDQLMRLGWKVFLPLSLFWLTLVAVSVRFFHIHL